MFYGAGNLFFATNTAPTGVGSNIMLPACIASFSLTFEDNFIQAKCLRNGRRVVVSSEVTESIPTLELTFEVEDWSTVQLIYDEFAATLASAVVPELRVATTNGSGEITDADITGSEVYGVNFFAYATEEKSYLTSADVVLAASTITIAGNPNQTIEYVVYVTKTNIDAIGVSNSPARFGRISFSGTLYNTETTPRNNTLLLIDQMTRTNTPTLEVTGDLPEITVSYQPETAPGNPQEYQLYQLS